MKYFAYGSNLSLPRLQARIPVMTCYGVYQLMHHELRFHKRGQDGSAKCDAWFTGDAIHQVYGVLYEIADAAKHQLDLIEGLGRGYEQKQVEVYQAGSNSFEATTYYATHLDDSLQPFHWYKTHVIRGAEDAGFPEQYLRKLHEVEAREDPDSARAQRQMAIYTG